ncbi:MAG: hypothetical protein K8F25_14960 [Fimbriimonadaceae bacterium]|nr:hypothetical protein [Alphaproteobacteria bacterium]
MQKYLFQIFFSLLIMTIAAPAFAMSITNKDDESRLVVITENGTRSERDVASNETVQLCEQGCFITFPDGTLTAYQGDEKIAIRRGGPELAN